MSDSFKDISRQNWTSSTMTFVEKINAGSLQRIADATEAMAKNYTKMQSDLELYKRWYNEQREMKRNFERSNSGLRGQITKLKKKLDTAKLNPEIKQH